MKKVIISEAIVLFLLSLTLALATGIPSGSFETVTVAIHLIIAFIGIHWFEKLWERAFCISKAGKTVDTEQPPYILMSLPDSGIIAVVIMSCSICLGRPVSSPSVVFAIAITLGGGHMLLEHLLMKAFSLKNHPRYRLLDYLAHSEGWINDDQTDLDDDEDDF